MDHRGRLSRLVSGGGLCSLLVRCWTLGEVLSWWRIRNPFCFCSMVGGEVCVGLLCLYVLAWQSDLTLLRAPASTRREANQGLSDVGLPFL